jgi:short-subunit dehydrogenase
LIARRKEKLQDLATQLEERYTIQATVLAVDLTHDEAIKQIENAMSE